MEQITNFLVDMDGVLISGDTVIPGAVQFIEHLNASQGKYLVLTNNPVYTPKDLAHNLQKMGMEIPPELIFTSAMATAQFLQKQRPNGTAYVIGESGLTSSMHEAGYIITEHDPDYVVLGETSAFSLENLTKGIRLIIDGARFVATNPDPSGPTAMGIVPACGAVADVGAAGLEVGAVAARGDLAVARLAGEPDLEVVGLGGSEPHVSRGETDRAIGQLE